jgi:hypothetical protein
MEDKEKLEEETSTEEKLRGIGQEILGDLEIIGGMLTGDGISTAEGKFNVGVGEIRQESSEALDETDDEEE